MTRLLVALIALALAACGSQEPSLFLLRSAEETGITFANLLEEDDSLYNALDFDYIYNGAGVGVGDLNNDGLQDVFFAANMVSSRLYLNGGDFRFEDVTEAAGLATDAWATGVSMVDIDQDGLLDIYLSVAGPDSEDTRANLLFVNQGADEDGVPRFVEQAEEYGIADTGYSTHAVFMDYDRDGLLDLYVLTNALESFHRNLIRPKRMGGEASSTDRLYRNNGDGTFTDVSREAGILIEGYGLGVVAADLNGNGWTDIYVANDFLTNDLVWVNNGDGTFTNRAGDYLKHQSHNSMGVDIADFNNDALLDIMVADMLPRDNLRKKLMLAGSNYDAFHMKLGLGYEPQYVRNVLQLNNGIGPGGEPSFSEIGQLAGVHDTDWSWAPLFVDVNNNGLRDLLVTNGYRRDVTNLDFIAFSQESQTMQGDADRTTGLLEALRALPEVELPNYVFRNNGDLTFTDETEAWGLDIPSYSTGAAFADLNNDGDLDLVISNIDGEAFVFENRSESLPDRNFLRVALEGPPGDVDGYGAKLMIRYGAEVQYDDYSPYRGYKSSVEQVVHFGLGAVTRVDSLAIEWPDGSSQVLRDIAANQVLTLRHADANRGESTKQALESSALERDYLFDARSLENGLDFRHESRELADFKHTPLLPHKHSQNGPGIAVGDVTGNGLEDVYIGTGRGQEKAVFLQTEPGRFMRSAIDDDETFEDMGALFFDANGDGRLDLYVVSGGGFLTNYPAEYQDRLYINDGGGTFRRAEDEALPEVVSSGSCVIAADYDGDGRLDLFVCGRIRPGEYPLPARSYLLRNESEPGGPVRFADVTDEVATGLADVGLVTDALWTDFDQDGSIDLILVGEWMPITFFRNDGGRFVDITDATGLGKTNGWWNSIVAGDFDNNGRVDYIVGNLGLNSEYRASEHEPMRVHAADFDNNGSIDPVLSYYIQGESHAAHPRDALIGQMIPMRGRFRSYEDYGNATLTQTLSAEERDRALMLESVTFETSYIENLGDGQFERRALPLRAQFAPTFGMLVNDFDADGNLDATLVGNSHATEPRIGWYTASTGSFLRGDGRGTFEYADGVQSGFFVDGDAKGIAELVLDEARSLVLVTQNNDDLRVFSPPPVEGHRLIRPEPLDAYAVLTFPDGSQRRHEFYYGSTYLAQSSRQLRVPPGAESVVIHDSSGATRTVTF